MIREVRPVEVGQTMWILGEVRGDPIYYHADARPVERIDEVLEVVRRPEPARRGEEPERLVAPGAVERVLGRGQELDVGVTHLAHVGHELLGELAVGVVGAVRVPAPGAQMYLVDGYGCVE